MLATGLNLSPQRAPAEAAPREFSVGGIMSARPLSALMAEERKAAQDRATEANNDQLVQSLASLIRRHWTIAKEAKLEPEREMLQALRAKRGQYPPDKLAQIRQQGSSEIYMMLFATKARQAKALLSDVLMGTKNDKPWTISPTPDPKIPQDVTNAVLLAAQEAVAQAEMSGMPMSTSEIRIGLRDVKDQITAAILEEARVRCGRAEVKVEDLLAEGGFLEALDQFCDDLMVFRTAFIKGPVIRKRGALTWVEQEDGTSLPEATYENKPHYERVDPLNVYPAPWARSVHDAFLIERHKLSPTAISELKGVEGYSDDAIDQVMAAYSTGGLAEWLQVDSERATAEGRSETNLQMSSDLIEALQYWGSVTGKVLREWGLGEDEVPDESKVYEVEAWLIGGWVIKAVINSDPLARRPYFGDSFERTPGAFWGNSLYDVMRDCEDMCNAAARSLANNMGISSGPQVWVNVDRLPNGEDITTLYPWKIWQTTQDQMGSTAAPMGFFQPTSNAQELMAVFDKFSTLADEYTGVPRYMAGVGGGAGEAGRTASGMSMMIGNANKTVKKQVSSIDLHIIGPLVSSAYEFLMRYVGDPDIKGDLNVVARGALSLVTKDAAQVRRNEFLTATNNPTDMQIIGMEGRAALLRETARTLDMNTDNVVPTISVLKARMAQQMLAQQQAAMAQQQQQPAPGGRQLEDGSPAIETFQNK